MIKLYINKYDGAFIVDAPARPGSPSVGRGRTMMEALGSWLHNNQDFVGVVIDISDSVTATEVRRRQRELAKR